MAQIMAQWEVPSPCLRNWQKYCPSPRLRQAYFVFEIQPSLYRLRFTEILQFGPRGLTNYLEALTVVEAQPNSFAYYNFVLDLVSKLLNPSYSKIVLKVSSHFKCLIKLGASRTVLATDRPVPSGVPVESERGEDPRFESSSKITGGESK